MAMSSSSGSKYDTSLSDQLSQHLINVRSYCIAYQCHLIEHILENLQYNATDLAAIFANLNYKKEDLFVIMHALQHERDIAGNLAGKLSIELHGDKWSIAKTDFLEKLTKNDEAIITQKLLSKRKFTEADIKEILQDLLITKFDLLLNIRK